MKDEQIDENEQNWHQRRTNSFGSERAEIGTLTENGKQMAVPVSAELNW